jgi:hypothetical protein
MMNFNNKIIRTSEIQDLGNIIDIPLYKGPRSTNVYQYAAQTISSNNINFNINVGSESQMIDREVLIRNTMNFRSIYTFTTAPTQNTKPIQIEYSQHECIQAFPFNQLITSTNLKINNSSVSINNQDLIPVLSKCLNQKDVNDFDCPTLFDTGLKNYGVTGNNSHDVFRGYHVDTENVGRGGFDLTITVSKLSANGGTADNATATLNTSTHNTQLISDAFSDASTMKENFIGVIEFVYKITTTEPLLFLSPLLYSDSNNRCSMHSINTIQLNLLLDQSGKRAFSAVYPELAADTAGGYNRDYSFIGIDKSELILKYYTGQETDKIITRNVLPHVEYLPFITSDGTDLDSGVSRTKSINPIQFSTIPSKIYIAIRKPLSVQTEYDSSGFLAIEKINITFNNITGILSTYSPFDLWKLSKKNGSKQSWSEFKGFASTEGGSKQYTLGGVLVLNPSLDFNMGNVFSNGVLGMFNFQCEITYKNTTYSNATYTDVYDTFKPEIVVISENNGLFISEAGMSSIIQHSLTKEQVLSETQTQSGISLDYFRKMSVDNKIKNIPEVNELLKSGEDDEMTGKGVMSGGMRMRSGGNSSDFF